MRQRGACRSWQTSSQSKAPSQNQVREFEIGADQKMRLIIHIKALKGSDQQRNLKTRINSRDQVQSSGKNE